MLSVLSWQTDRVHNYEQVLGKYFRGVVLVLHVQPKLPADDVLGTIVNIVPPKVPATEPAAFMVIVIIPFKTPTEATYLPLTDAALAKNPL